MNGFTRLEDVDRVAQSELQFPFHDENKFLTFMFVCHRLVGMMRFDGDHEGSQVIALCAGCQGPVGILACAFDIIAFALITDLLFFFTA